MVQTKKFSQFATANLADSSNTLVGVGGPGINIKATKVTAWTTLTRPSPPFNGLLGLNIDLEAYEFYDSTIADWVQLGDSGDIASIFAILAAHTVGNGASRIGLQDQSNVTSKTVQNLANEVFLVGSSASSLQNAQVLTAGTNITLTPGVGTLTIDASGGGGSVNPGLTNQLAWYASDGSVLSGLATANDGTLITSAGGVPSISSTLPNAVQLNITALGTQTQALNMGNHLINNVTDPVSAQDACTKAYADSIVGGLTPVPGVDASSVAPLTVVYNNGTAGVGATLTNNTTQAAFVIDGYTASVNDRILIKNQASTFQNGIYSVTNVGSGATNWILTRATDYDQPAEIKPGNLVAVANGTVNEGSSWLQTATVAAIGTDPILFSPFFIPADFLLKSNNLSDVSSVPTSLVNLGLGTPTGTGNVVLNNTPSIITPEITTGLFDENSNTILGLNPSATAVNYIQIQNAATGNQPSLAFVGSDANITGNLLTSGTGGFNIQGVKNATNAPAGFIGEFVSSVIATASSVALVNATSANLTSISLAPGDWDVWGNVTFGITGNCSTIVGWLSSVSATQPDSSLFSLEGVSTGSLVGGSGMCVPSRRFSLAMTTTVYISARAFFTTGTAPVCGGIYARRVR